MHSRIKEITEPAFIYREQHQAIYRREVLGVRTFPVVMTALMASIGLLPAAVSTGIGSESQKPLAIVITGGLVTATVLTLLVFPIIFWIFHRPQKHHLEEDLAEQRQPLI